jgi:hypothetical protein
MMQRSCALRRATTPHIPVSDAVEGTPDRDAAQPSYRVCVAGGCSTMVSAFNPSSWCAVHDRLSPQARKGRRASRPTDARGSR